jgi:hypothetical protein
VQTVRITWPAGRIGQLTGVEDHVALVRMCWRKSIDQSAAGALVQWVTVGGGDVQRLLVPDPPRCMYIRVSRPRQFGNPLLTGSAHCIHAG